MVRWTVILALLSLCRSASADPLALTLSDCVRLALEANTKLRVKRLDMRDAHVRAAAEKGAFVTVHGGGPILAVAASRGGFLDHSDRLQKGIDKSISPWLHVVCAGSGDTHRGAGAGTSRAPRVDRAAA